MKMTIAIAIDILHEWFEEQHGGCDQTTCDISNAWNSGYSLWAIYLLNSAHGEIDNEEQAEAINYLTKTKYWKVNTEKERQLFINEVPHYECKHCNAVIWHPEDCNWDCDSCGTSNIMLALPFEEYMIEMKKMVEYLGLGKVQSKRYFEAHSILRMSDDFDHAKEKLAIALIDKYNNYRKGKRCM